MSFMLKTIICGSRRFNDYEFMKAVLDSIPWEISEVVSGRAKGADTLGEKWSQEFLSKEAKMFPAAWDKFGRAAGPIRNKQMKDYAEACVAFYLEGSKGTQNMIDQFQKTRRPIVVVDCGNGFNLADWPKSLKDWIN